ncbi:uncharacterized protein [Linepithema humile]|uniref:uncharacterized protein n=1 Tax=Linepithema humile TaxID=83485 RepID=UPI00351E692C
MVNFLEFNQEGENTIIIEDSEKEVEENDDDDEVQEEDTGEELSGTKEQNLEELLRERVQLGGGGGGMEENSQQQQQSAENQAEETNDNEIGVRGEGRLEREEDEEALFPENQVGAPEQIANHNGDNFNYLDLIRENVREFRNFGVVGREAGFRLRSLPEGEEIYAWLENAFRELHAYAVLSCVPGDYIGLSFDSPNLSHEPAGISFRPSRDLTHENIWNLVSSLAQSSGGLNVAQEFNIHVYRVTPPTGRAGNALDIAGKRSILTISNSDNLCFPRALVTAQIYNERGNLRTGSLQERWNAVRYRHSSLQRELARDLTRKVGITIPEEGCGIREIEHFQQYLAAENIAIMVYSAETFGHGGKVLFDGNAILASLHREPVACLNILHHAELRHYSVILNLRAAAGSRGYCVPCNVGYRSDVRGHRCSNKCPRCYAVPSCERFDAERIHCENCNREFFNHACLGHHRAQKSYDGQSSRSVCNTVCFCEECGRLIERNRQHECGVTYCSTCRSAQPLNHLCHMLPLPHKANFRTNDTEHILGEGGEQQQNAGECVLKTESRVAFVFYDFETRQDDTLQGTASVNIHVPTLCVAQQICETCAEIEDTSVRCRWCSIREYIFRRDPVKEFVDFATRPTKYFKHIICIAHNAKAFDAQFILRYIVESGTALEPRVILNGTKIVVLTVGHTKFIDSINYMPMRLSELPKAFGLTNTSDKGIFPHLFNTNDNQSYVGPLPDIRYYSPDSMNTNEREKFLAWHAEMIRTNYVFDFECEILRYCRNDVNILRRACMSFRKIFLKCGRVCPFEECTTIASTCMRVFRKNFLREREIGIIPPGGYRRANTQSRKALQWLVWKERELGHNITHAGRTREYRLQDGTLVDGYYELVENGITHYHVLQFHGCFWHGCPSCFKINRDRELTTGVLGDREVGMRL